MERSTPQVWDKISSLFKENHCDRNKIAKCRIETEMWIRDESELNVEEKNINIRHSLSWEKREITNTIEYNTVGVEIGLSNHLESYNGTSSCNTNTDVCV